jgi:chemotaxis response regulator CheB
METEIKSPLEKVNILVVGNNPIELSRVFDSLNRITGKKIMTEIAFDLKSIFERLVKFRPEYILIDDNIGKVELKNAVRALLKDRKTKDIPITVLKNSNYHEAISTGVLNFILKENINGDSLYTALRNSSKFRKTQLYLYSSYKKRKGQLLRLMQPD